MGKKIMSFQTKTETVLIYDITDMWNLKNNPNEYVYKRETDSQI